MAEIRLNSPDLGGSSRSFNENLISVLTLRAPGGGSQVFNLVSVIFTGIGTCCDA